MGNCFCNLGCDDIIWILILLFIICNCCGNDGRRGIGGGCGCN